MPKSEDKALMTTQEHSGELQETAAGAAAAHEIQSAIVIAQRFRRNEDAVYQALLKTSKRPAFAEIAQYQFPRGNTTVRGPSVNMAREAGRCWGNCRWGLEVVRDEDDTRLIRGWAWDLQTNTKISLEDSFRKLIQRKSNGQTKWIKPDERDLRELTNRMGAILVRNCLLQVIPRDFIDDALAECHRTLQDEAAGDPESAKKRVLGAFSSINVSVESLEQFLGTRSPSAPLKRSRTCASSTPASETATADGASTKIPPEKTQGRTQGASRRPRWAGSAWTTPRRSMKRRSGSARSRRPS